MYSIVHGKNIYMQSLNTNISRMYAIVQRKFVSTKKNTVMERVNPRNLAARKNIGYQATCDKETREKERKSRRKTLNTPKKEISLVESPILL
jgi:hypothetical protein